MEPSFDSRRAWLVTFGAFMISAVVDGISFSFGILFTELLEYFGESKSLTAWVISVYGGTYRIVGR